MQQVFSLVSDALLDHLRYTSCRLRQFSMLLPAQVSLKDVDVAELSQLLMPYMPEAQTPAESAHSN